MEHEGLLIMVVSWVFSCTAGKASHGAVGGARLVGWCFACFVSVYAVALFASIVRCMTAPEIYQS